MLASAACSAAGTGWMAAIGGLLALDDGFDLRALAAGIGQRMAHRAPDGSCLHVEPGFAMLHGALHATPESASLAQPLVLGDWVIAVDGRIDDRPGLLHALGIAHADGTHMPDALLFARAWQSWGEDFWRHVAGDFALAAWHRRDRVLHLVRDRVGVRPLYFAHAHRLFAFASEQEALAGLPGVSTDFDDDRIAYYLAPAFVDDDPGATWLRDVRRLQPGECLRVDAGGGVALSRYWRMAPLESLRFRDAGEAADAFRDVFDAAVACRLRSPARIGLMLSGGIDSASILAASLRLSRRDGIALPRPVSILDDALHPGEAANIAAVAGQVDDALCIRFPGHASTASFRRFVEDFWAGADGWSAAALPRLAYRVAREAGLRVVLDGIDGDLALWAPGDPSTRLLLGGQPRAAWREAQAAARHHTDLQGQHPLRILAGGMARHWQPRWVRRLRMQMRGRRDVGHVFGPAIHPDFARALDLNARQRAIANAAADAYAEGTQQALIHAWWSPGFTRAMEGFDAMAAREGIEPRHPWADLRVLEFLLRLPDDLRVQAGWTKAVARAISAPEIGPEVAWHAGKDHFGHVVVEAVLHASAQRVQSLVDQRRPWLEARVHPVHLAGLRAASRSGTQAADAYATLDIAVLAAWADRLAGRQGRNPGFRMDDEI